MSTPRPLPQAAIVHIVSAADDLRKAITICGPNGSGMISAYKDIMDKLVEHPANKQQAIKIAAVDDLDQLLGELLNYKPRGENEVR